MKALIVNDLQNDFHPSGMAAIEKSDQLVPVINNLMEGYELNIATQLFYPANHIIFAGNHIWRKPNQIIEINEQEIQLTEMHCVANSFGAELMVGLNQKKIHQKYQKGTQKDIPAHCAFFDVDKVSNGLKEFLKKMKVTEIHFSGINHNENLSFSIQIAKEFGFHVNIISEACLGL